MFKKLFNTTMAFVLVATTLAPMNVAFASTYQETAEMAFDRASTEGITSAASLAALNAQFANGAQRQAIAAYAVRAARLLGLKADTSKTCTFPDLNQAMNDDIRDLIVEACQMNLMNGMPDGKFAPTAIFTLHQSNRVLAALASQVMGDDLMGSDPRWRSSYDYLANMPEPVTSLSLSEVSARGNNAEQARDFLIKLMKINDQVSGEPQLPIECILDPTLPQCVNSNTGVVNTGVIQTGVVNQVKAGSLNVVLSSDTPASRTVPMTATAVPFTKFKMTAGDKDITVNSIEVLRQGAGNTNEISNVYLYNGNERITDGRTVSSNTNKARFTFAGSNALVIKAGSSMEFTVRADLSGVASNQHKFGIDSDGIVSSAATVSGLPVMGNPMTLASVNIGQVTITPRAVANTQVSVGDQSAEIAKFNISVNSVEAANFQAITLALAGNISASNLSDLKLVDSNNNVIATAPSLKRAGTFDSVVFTLKSPLLIERGSDRTYSVKATLNGGRNADTVGFYVANSTDILLEGQTFGSNLAINTANSTLFGNNNTFTTLPASILSSNQYAVVKAGRLTFTYAGPNTQNISRGMTNVVLAVYNVNNQAGQDIEVRNLLLNLSGTNASSFLFTGNVATFQNIRLMEYPMVGTSAVLGNIISSASDPTSTYSQDLRFSDSFTLKPGQTRFALVANVPSSVSLANVSYQVSFNPADSRQTFRSSSTNETISTNDIVPGVALASNVSTLLGSALTVSYTALPTTTFVVGTTNQIVGILNLQASDAMDVNLNALSVVAGGSLNGANGRNTVSSVMLYDYSNNTIGNMLNGISSNSLDINGNASFSNLGFNVPKSTTKKIAVVANLSSNASAVTTGGTIVATGFDVTQSVNGSSVSAAVAGTPTQFSVIASGSVTIATVAGSTNRIQGGATNQLLGTFSFRANRISYDIKTLSFALSGSTGAVNGVPTSFRLLDSANTVLGTASLTPASTDIGGVVRFSNMNYRLTQDQTVNLRLVADFGAINNNTNAAANGATIQAGLYAKVSDNQDDIELAPVNAQGLASIKDNGVSFATSFNGGLATYSNALSTLVRSIPVISVVPAAGMEGNTPTATTPLIIKITNGSSNDITLQTANLSFANVGGKYSSLPVMGSRQMFDGGNSVGTTGSVTANVANFGGAVIPANTTRYIRFNQSNAGTATNINTNAYRFIDLDNTASAAGAFVWNDGSANFNGFNLYTNQLIGINQ